MPCPDGLEAGFGIRAPAQNAICFSKSYFGIGPDGLGVYRSGTGFLVETGSQFRHVLTAAHNVYHHGVRREAEWISLWFGRNANVSIATRNATGWAYPREFGDAKSAPGDCDFALLRIKPLGADRFNGLTIATSTAQGATDKLILGYPDEGACKGRAEPWHAQMAVEPSGVRTYRYLGQDTYAGMSGGPLITRDAQGEGYKAWGIHIRGGGDEAQRAIRFAPEVVSQIMGWV